MSFTADYDNLPRDVQQVLNDGFILTDIDDRFERSVQSSHRVWDYRSGTEDQNFLSRIKLQ